MMLEETQAQSETTVEPIAPPELARVDTPPLSDTTPVDRATLPVEVFTDAQRLAFLAEMANTLQCIQNDGAVLGLVITDLATFGSIKSGELALFKHN